ncbi:hypothetical protein Y032_0079g1249 [Ancylostoma ceylanicum]|uniref:Uncharacterized protein n=1 Tax=Ancylostoma ceylanicum TaxID=53326 RepID=A0A016TU23_9BILA|nr:hypothetical protein Y032_0079g1249 [Ancylostoma ceylanicum]
MTTTISVWQRSMVIHLAIDTYHFHDPYLFYRRFILIHFELAKSEDTPSLSGAVMSFHEFSFGHFEGNLYWMRELKS